MRKFLGMCLALLFVVSLNAQSSIDKVFALDTLDESESSTFTLGPVIKDLGAISFHVAGLKISGATGGTISYQAAYDNDGTNWYEMATDTITNGTTSQIYEATNFTGRRARVVITADGTTQSGSYRVAVSFKRSN